MLKFQMQQHVIGPIGRTTFLRRCRGVFALYMAWLVIWPHFALATQQDLITYVKAHYLKPDEQRDFVPVNRFQRISGSIEEPLKASPPDKDLLAVEEKISEAFRDSNSSLQVKLEARVRTPVGVFVFFRAVSPCRELTGEGACMDEDKKDFLYSFALQKKGSPIWLADMKVAHLDLETESYARELWDIIRHDAKRYVLILRTEYEVTSFELYELTPQRLKMSRRIPFGGL